jgi:mRNA interferase RelE/StbE
VPLTVTLSRSAVKALLGMQPKKAAAIRAAIGMVAADPRARNNNLKALKGVDNGFRLRIGDWRVSFTLDYTTQKMDVYEIAPRGGAYR